MTGLPVPPPPPPLSLGRGVEFDLIRAMTERWGALAVGIGDDAALLTIPRGDQAVLSTDTALEHVHFHRDWLSLREIAYRAVTAALSDLAAMAATPLGILLALQWPARGSRDDLLLVADGVADAVRAAGGTTRIFGGNIARADVLGITTTVVGSVHDPLTRAGARPGDLLYVTGRLGAPAAVVRALGKNLKPVPELRERFAAPRARIAEARWLAHRGAVAGIDLSDGLSSDAAHLAAASGVALEIAVERVPVFPGVLEDDALTGGEEYELLLASRAPLPADEFERRFALPLTLVGRALEGGTEVRFHRHGERVAVPSGYDHFSR